MGHLHHTCMQEASADVDSSNDGRILATKYLSQLHPQPHHHHHHHHHHYHHYDTNGHALSETRSSTSERLGLKKSSSHSKQHSRASTYPTICVEEALHIISQKTPTSAVVEVPVTPSVIGSVLAGDVYATKSVPAQQNSLEPDSEVALGSKILSRGDQISSTGGELTQLAASGVRNLKVFKKPRVGILSTRNEPVGSQGPDVYVDDDVRNSHRLSLLSCITSWGFEAVDLGIARDTLVDELNYALSSVEHSLLSVDLIVTTGAASMGELDLQRSSIDRALGATIHFAGVSMKPGKHTTFATLPLKPPSLAEVSGDNVQRQASSKPIFLLFGNEASALVALNLFVLPCLKKLAGLGESSEAISSKSSIESQLGLPHVAVVLTHYVPVDPTHTEYHRAIVTGSRSDGRLYATSAGADGVGRNAKANALLMLRPGRGVGIKGEIVEALMMGPVYGSDTRVTC